MAFRPIFFGPMFGAIFLIAAMSVGGCGDHNPRPKDLVQLPMSEQQLIIDAFRSIHKGGTICWLDRTMSLDIGTLGPFDPENPSLEGRDRNFVNLVGLIEGWNKAPRRPAFFVPRADMARGNFSACHGSFFIFDRPIMNGSYAILQWKRQSSYDGGTIKVYSGMSLMKRVSGRWEAIILYPDSQFTPHTPPEKWPMFRPYDLDSHLIMMREAI